MTTRLLSLALLAGLTAAPLAAQSFVSPDCPANSTRVGNACYAPNGTVVQRFALPQIEEADEVQVYDLSSDSPYRSGDGDRVVIRKNAFFITDLDTNLTVIAD